MLTRLHLKNFTVFADADFQFSTGLNVIVGENGAGKSHVLKAAYTVIDVMTARDSGLSAPTKSYLATAVARKLRAVFRPDAFGRLVRRQAGRNRCEVRAQYQPRTDRLDFSFNTASKTEVVIDALPAQWKPNQPVFLPTRELLTIASEFVSLYETTELPLEETWRDTCILLGAPLAKGARFNEIREMLEPLEELLDGKVVVENGRFYIKTSTGSLEAHLVAEGLRKLAMIARLIATGVLAGTGTLFWDEPESNLNPKIIKKVARTILQLCRSGTQVFVASHSLFLIRELDILLKLDEFRQVKARFFGLQLGENGVTVEQGASVDDIGKIDALDEELSQSDRYVNLAEEAEASMTGIPWSVS